MPRIDLEDWLVEHDRPNFVWFIKRLSGNDTLATGAHQAGPYIPKNLVFELFPELDTTDRENPDTRFNLQIDSHGDLRNVRLIYYNNRVTGQGTRNETRITGFGGQASPLLNPASTGAIAVFAFLKSDQPGDLRCKVWVCDSAGETDTVEDLVGPVEPGIYSIRRPGQDQVYASTRTEKRDCRLAPNEIPAEWLVRFPSGAEIIQKTLELRPERRSDPDKRIVKRRVCEFEIFQSIEEQFFGPRIRGGFQSIEQFVELAQKILQSRKSRAGNSLELHARKIMEEEGLVSQVHFHHKPITDGNKRPDFIFPSQRDYDDMAFPADRLRLLAVKTTCRDRWRQILNEADRIGQKHLLTIQDGLSEAQFTEMRDAGVQLVVPAGLHHSYPASVRPHLQTLEGFIADIRNLGYDRT